MIEIVGDLWDEHAKGAVVVITTNGIFNKVGRAEMPRGCARQARDKYPHLLQTLGALLKQHGNHVFDLGNRIVSFPVEKSPYETPELRLIEQSCQELVELVDYKEWQKVVVPRPGCGGGGLSWGEVRPILQKYLDDRFFVISMEQ